MVWEDGGGDPASYPIPVELLRCNWENPGWNPNNAAPGDRRLMIDKHGFRANVGIILLNAEGQVFCGRRVGMSAWQFPQGGIKRHESPEVAMYRELKEEVGLEIDDVELFAVGSRRAD